MQILNGAIPPLCIVNFIMFAIQYFHFTAEHLACGVERKQRFLCFGLMVGMVILLVVSVAFPNSPVSPIFFLLALLSLGLAIYLFRDLWLFRQ